MSSITIINTDSAEIASFNRGPLTSVFTPPASCLSTLTYGDVGMYFGHADTDFYDSSCYPSSYSSIYTLIADNGNWNQYYYSPAQCPQAWAQARTFTSYFTNAADVAGQIWFPLGTETTAVLCCPSGYAYFGRAGHQCYSTLSAGGTLVYRNNVISNNALVLGSVATTTITGSGAYTVLGDGIPVWWQSSDLEAFTAPPRTTTSQIRSTSSPNSPSAPTSSSNFSGPPTPEPAKGLSTGAKVAIGVVIPLVALAALLGIFFFFRRRGRKRPRAQGEVFQQDGERKYPNETGELPVDSALAAAELENRHPRYELADR